MIDYKELSKIGGEPTFMDARNENASNGRVLDDFMRVEENRKERMSRVTDARRRVVDSKENKHSVVEEKKKRVNDSITAEQLLEMKRADRRSLLGSLPNGRRRELLRNMHNIKESRIVDSKEDEKVSDDMKMKLINLVVLANNVKKNDTEYTRQVLANCVKGLPEEYSDYIYSVIDGDESNLSDEEFESIHDELSAVASEVGLEDLVVSRKITDSAIDEVMETPSNFDTIDKLMRGIGNFLKTGNTEELVDIRESIVMGEDIDESDDSDEKENDESIDEIESSEETEFVEKEGESADDTEREETMFSDTESDESSLDEPSEDTDESELSEEDETDSADEFTDDEQTNEIEVPEDTPEEVVNLVQNLLDMIAGGEITDSTHKFIVDSITGTTDSHASWNGKSDVILDESVEFDNQLVRVPLSPAEYKGLSNNGREETVKSVMPKYPCAPCTVEQCNNRTIKVKYDDGSYAFWTPIYGAVDESFPKDKGECAKKVSDEYVPTSEFCRYASNLNELDLIDKRFYKKLVEDGCWYVSDDMDDFNLKSGDCVYPAKDGEIKIYDKCYNKFNF